MDNNILQIPSICFHSINHFCQALRIKIVRYLGLDATESYGNVYQIGLDLFILMYLKLKTRLAAYSILTLLILVNLYTIQWTHVDFFVTYSDV